jgi:hypothetical protein
MAQSSDFKRIKNSDSSDFKIIEMGSFTCLLNTEEPEILNCIQKQKMQKGLNCPTCHAKWHSPETGTP